LAELVHILQTEKDAAARKKRRAQGRNCRYDRIHNILAFLRGAADAFPEERRARTNAARERRLRSRRPTRREKDIIRPQTAHKIAIQEKRVRQFPSKQREPSTMRSTFVRLLKSFDAAKRRTIIDESFAPRFRRENDPFAILTKIRGVGNRKTGNFRSFQEKNVATFANLSNAATFRVAVEDSTRRR